jgi:hypothetical protein
MTAEGTIHLVSEKTKTLAEKLGGYSGPILESFKYRNALKKQEKLHDLHSEVQKGL